MKNRGGFINEKELKRAIKLMKENKATDESGMIAEYINSLVEQDLINLMRMLNDVLTRATEGACSMAVPAMSTRPRTSAIRMPFTHPAIRNADHR